MNRREYYRQKYRKLNSDWKDSSTKYTELIDDETSPRTKILDIGCGCADFLKTVYSKTKNTYGLDSDKKALSFNTIIKHKLCGSADEMPFGDNSFDVVVLAWVLEHLNNPKKAFFEIHRVLKCEGKVIFLTPNIWNYVVCINRLVPNKFHDFIARKLYHRGKDSTFPVRYKINSITKIDKILSKIGFKKCQVIFNGDPSYISLNDTSFKLASFIERLLNIKKLQSYRVHLIGVYQK